jgi:molybdopterin/thiamine biosynthesis adenylyltransferase
MNPFVISAVHYGFRRFVLIDMDRVERSNCNRLIGVTPADEGSWKVEVMRRYIETFDPACEVEVVRERVQSKAARDALRGVDVLVNGFDNNEARLDAQILAARRLTPMLDMGTAIYLDEGQVRVVDKGSQIRFYVPGSACLLCQGLDTSEIVTEIGRSARAEAAEGGYVVGTGASPASVITLNSVIANIAVDLLVSFLTGVSDYRTYVQYDELARSICQMDFVKSEECPICGENGIEGLGDLPVADDGHARTLAVLRERLRGPSTRPEGKAAVTPVRQNGERPVRSRGAIC